MSQKLETLIIKDPKNIKVLEIATGILFKLKEYDSYSLAGSFPDGLDVQVFSFDAIKKSHEQATSSFDREHVGNFIEKTRPDLFVNGEFHKFKNCGHYRWTLDSPNDFVFLKKVFEHLYLRGKIFHYFDIINLLSDFYRVL